MQRTQGLWLVAFGILVCAAPGCATMDTQVRERAARDFSCRSDQLRMVDSEATVFRIAGCGSIATYRCEESPFAMHCKRASWDQPDSQYVSTANGAYSIERRSLADAERAGTPRK